METLSDQMNANGWLARRVELVACKADLVRQGN